MPFDGSGNFSRDYNWQQDRDNDIHIMAERMDGEFDNYAGGLNMTFLRSGIVPMQGNLNMGNNRILSVNNGTAASPGIKFNSDANSGLYLSSLNNVGIATNGLARLVVNNSGITVTGNADVSGTLNVSGDATFGRANFGDTNYAAYLSGGNPVLLFDTSDYLNYNRASNGLGVYLGGNAYAAFNTVDGLAVYRGSGVTVRGSGAAGVRLGMGPSATSSGTLDFLNNIGGSVASIGIPAVPSDIIYNAISANVTGHYFEGGPVRFGDTNYSAYLSGTSPVLLFDTNDYVDFNRGTNTYNFRTGTTVQLSVSPTSVAARAEFSAPRFSLDSTGYLSTSSGNPILSFDTNDYILYNRSTDQMQFRAGNFGALTLSASGVSFAGAVSAPTSAVTAASLTTTAGVTVGTSLNVGGDATITGTTYFGDASYRAYISGTSTVLLFDSAGGDDYISYNRTANSFNFQIGSAPIAGITATGLSHVGSVSAGTTLSVGSTSTFTGRATFNAGVTLPAGSDISFDSTANIQVASGTPTFAVDTNDVFRYNRASNRYEFTVGGAVVGAIDATTMYNGTVSASNEVGYKDIPQTVQSGSYTLAMANRGGHVYYAGAGGHTYTIPPNSSVAFPVGSSIVIVNNGSGNLTIARGAGVTMQYGAVSPTNANRTLAPQAMATLIKVASDTWFISGNNLV